MTELRKTFLFGYSKSSVEAVISEMKQKYKSEIFELKNKVAELEREVVKYQEKEQFISDALVDSKRIARDILVDTEVKAKELMEETQEDITKRLNFTEAKIRELENVKRAIVDHEEFMKIELRQLFNRHLDLINTIDSANLQNYGTKIDFLLDESREALETMRQGLEEGEIETSKPKAVPTNVSSIKKNTVKSAAKAKNQLVVDEDSDIPVFTFDAF